MCYLLKVMRVVAFFPKITELKACFNQISRIDEPSNQNLIDRLRILDLESNPVEKWQYLKNLGKLNAYKYLNFTLFKFNHF